VPIVLFFLGLPRTDDAMSVGAQEIGQIEGSFERARGLADDGPVTELSFRELEGAAYSPERRSLYEGKTYKLKGKFSPAPNGDPNLFTLVRMKMNCCAADAVPLNAVIMVDPSSKGKLNPAEYQNRWVEVTGEVQFRRRSLNGREEWVTVMLVRPDDKHALEDLVRPTNPDNNPYV
jgi:hypothetical protein